MNVPRVWHPCDDFLNPLLQKLEPLIRDEASSDEIYAAFFYFGSDPYQFGINWIELQFSPEFGPRLTKRLAYIADEIGTLLRTLIRATNSLFAHENAEAARELSVHWQQFQHDLLDLLIFLRQFAGSLSANFPRFIPTEVQQDIWRALDGKMRTQLELMTELNIGSKETLNGKRGKGGIKEMIDLKLVAKGPKGRGYYRPDAPPD